MSRYLILTLVLLALASAVGIQTARLDKANIENKTLQDESARIQGELDEANKEISSITITLEETEKQLSDYRSSLKQSEEKIASLKYQLRKTINDDPSSKEYLSTPVPDPILSILHQNGYPKGDRGQVHSPSG